MKLIPSILIASSVAQIDYSTYDYSVEDYYNLETTTAPFDPADYGLADDEIFDPETLELFEEFEGEDYDLSTLGRSLGASGKKPKLPAGIKVADFITNGVFDKEGFRAALRQALVAQVRKFSHTNKGPNFIFFFGNSKKEILSKFLTKNELQYHGKTWFF